MKELKKLLSEIYDKEEIKPVKKGEGLIEYRKYLWAIKFIKESLQKLKDYKTDVLTDINEEINQKERQIEAIRNEIEKSVMADPVADETKSGGKKLSLPDIATVSISKLRDKYEFEDEETVIDELGEDFQRVKVSLDKRKTKRYMKETGNIPAGVTKYQKRRFSIRFKE